MREEGEGIGLMIKVVEETGPSPDPLHHTKPDLSGCLYPSEEGASFRTDANYAGDCNNICEMR